MNLKHIIGAITIGLAATGAGAIEATQFEVPPSTLTREEVKAELARAMSEGTLLSRGEATNFEDRPVAGAQRTREEVRAEAIQAARTHKFDELYVGSV